FVTGGARLGAVAPGGSRPAGTPRTGPGHPPLVARGVPAASDLEIHRRRGLRNDSNATGTDQRLAARLAAPRAENTARQAGASRRPRLAWRLNSEERNERPRLGAGKPGRLPGRRFGRSGSRPRRRARRRLPRLRKSVARRQGLEPRDGGDLRSRAAATG